jgi:hypothetical protein
MARTEVPPGAVSMTVPFRYPERYSDATLAAELSIRLPGKPASGGTLPLTAPGAHTPAVVWVDAGSEVVVYLDSVKVKIAGSTLMVSIDLECDQTGRTPLIATLALAAPGDPAGLLAVTDDLPRGNGVLAARWGGAVISAVWAAMLGLVQDFASERNLAPAGFAASNGMLLLIASEPIVVNTGGLHP